MGILTIAPAELAGAHLLIEWRTISSFPDYEASSEGQIRRRFPGRRQKSTRLLAHHPGSTSGHLKVHLWVDEKNKNLWVHRLVCEAFHGPQPSPAHEVAHWDGDAANNRPGNLRWATTVENQADRVRHGRTNRGSRNGQSLLTEQRVLDLRARLAKSPKSSGGKRIRKGALAALAREYGVTPSGLHHAARSLTWKHI